MNFIPYERYNIVTKKTPDEVYTILKNNKEPNQWTSKPQDKKLSGVLLKDSFELYPVRRTMYSDGNSFLPVTRGTITAQANGTLIQVTSKLNVGAILLEILAIGVLIYLYVVGIKEIKTNHDPVPFIMAINFTVVNWALCLAGFKSDAKKVKQILCSLLKDED